MTTAVDRESLAYRALVHTPPCADSAVHARLVLDATYPNGDAEAHAEEAAHLIVLSRIAEQGLRLPVGLGCEA